MNILYIAHKDPRLKTGGNELRTNLLWEALKQKGKVYTLVISTTCCNKTIVVEDNHQICFANSSSKIQWLRKLTYKIINRLTGIPLLPYTDAINNSLSDFFPGVQIDVVVCRYIHSFRYYHFWKSYPVLLDIDDHPKQVYDTIISPSLPLFVRPFARFLCRKQYRYVFEKIKGGWLANKEQLVWCKNNVLFLPNIPVFPSDNYFPESNREEYLFTIGDMAYRPNYLGVNKFISEIWPSFHRKHPNIKYIIGGKGASQQMAEKWNSTEGVVYIGFVENLEEIYEKCEAAVVPIYSGGGTCIKTLEAMAYSRICLTSPFGVRGIPQKDIINKNGLCVFESAEDFNKQYEYIQNFVVRRNMEDGANRYVSENYSTDAFICAVNIFFN